MTNWDEKPIEEDYVGCMGGFTMEDTVCRQHCAVSLRCIIEQKKSDHLTYLDDLLSSDTMFIKIQ